MKLIKLIERKKRFLISLVGITCVSLFSASLVGATLYLGVIKPDQDIKRIRQEAAVETAKVLKADKAVVRERVRILGLATVGRGEGIEHAFIRQLINDPGILDGFKVKVGKKEYDLTYHGDGNAVKAVKKWAQSTAHILAIQTGFVGKRKNNIKEIRIKVAGQAAYMIVKEKDPGGNQVAKVIVFSKKAQGQQLSFTDKADYSSARADDYSQTKFKGSDALMNYEYVWKPHPYPKP